MSLICDTLYIAGKDLKSEIRNQFRTCMMMMGVFEYSSINNATCRRTRAAAASVDFIFRFIAS